MLACGQGASKTSTAMSVFTWFNMPTSDSQNGKEALGESFGGHPLWAEANVGGIHSLRRNSDLELQNSSWAYPMPEQGTMSGSVSSLISAG